MKLSQTLYALLLHLVPVRELHYINGADTLPAPLDLSRSGRRWRL